jgi:hypothetical protein
MRTILSWMTVLAVAASVIALIAGGDGRAPLAAQGAPPTNDDYANYKLVGLGLSPPGGGFEDIVQTAGATLEEGEPVCAPNAGATVWYVFYPQTASPITIDTTASDFATFIGVYRITNFAPSPPGGSLEQVACTTGGEHTLEFNAFTNNGGYAIQIGGLNAETGRLVARIACTRGQCPPANDLIEHAPTIVELPFAEELDTRAAGVEPGEPDACGQVAPTVWYRLNVFEPAQDSVTITASSTEFEPVIALYRLDLSVAFSPPGALVEVDCAYTPGADSQSLSFTTEPGPYYIQVSGANGGFGELSVQMSCTPNPSSPPDDACFFGAITADTGSGVPPDTGSGTPAPGGGTIGPPETGSGGYLNN